MRYEIKGVTAIGGKEVYYVSSPTIREARKEARYLLGTRTGLAFILIRKGGHAFEKAQRVYNMRSGRERIDFTRYAS